MTRLELDAQQRQSRQAVINQYNNKDLIRDQFQPDLSRTRKKSRGNSRLTQSSMSSNHRLYEQAFASRQKRRDLEDMRLREILESSSQRRTNQLSTQIMENILVEKMEEIFLMLDSDCDGLISASRINIGAVDQERLTIIAPLLIEMEDLGLCLDREVFLKAAKKLYKVNFTQVYNLYSLS